MTTSFSKLDRRRGDPPQRGAFAQTPGSAEPINSNFPQGTPAGAWDPTYNVCRGPYPKCYNDFIQRTGNTVLIYSRTAGPRHGNLGTALAPASTGPRTRPLRRR